QAEDGIRDFHVTGVQTCALPISYFNDENHETGKLQTRIDRGIESLTKLVQNFFIDILPLFSNAIIALIIMYMQNVYVGLVSTVVVPIYFYEIGRASCRERV